MTGIRTARIADRLRMALVAGLGLGLVVTIVGVAYAHNIFTTLDVRQPEFAARHWSFTTVHIANGCVEGGDSTPCSAGFDFKAHSGAQIKQSGEWQAFGTVVKSVKRHWPDSTSVRATKEFDCPSGHPTYTFRTRGTGGIVHNGIWYWTAFFFSPERTETC